MNESREPADLDRPVRLADGTELAELVDAHEVVLVEFYTKGCTLCQSMEPVLGNVARATDAVVGLLNPQNDLGLIERFDVRSVPHLILFVDGELVARKAEGFVGADEVVALIEEHAGDA